MKNVLLIALALFTMNAAAQAQRTEQSNRKTGSEMMKQMTPNERADLQTKKLTLKLDLSDAQQENVHAIILEQANTRENFRQARKIATAEKATKPSKDAVFKMRKDRRDQQIKLKRDMKAILTPDQYEKFEKIHSMKHNKRRKRGERQKQG